MAAGAAPADAERMLGRVAELEPGEYLSARGLTLTRRRELTALRAGLRGCDVAETELELSLSHSQPARTLRDYWSWLIGSAYPPGTGLRNRIPGNLAAAIGHQPEQREFVLRSWAILAGVIGIDAAGRQPALADLDATMGLCAERDTERPTVRALDLAIDISLLTGLPTELGRMHRSAWAEQQTVIQNSGEWFAGQRLRSGMAVYRGDAGDWTGRDPVWVAYAGHAPYPDQAAGAERLVLSPPESLQLGEDITNKVLIWLVGSLRLGHYPGSHLALRAANSVFLDRRNFKRDEHGEPIPPKERPVSDVPDFEPPAGTDDDEPTRAAAGRFLVARDWLVGALIDSMHELQARYERDGPSGAFPAEFYGSQRAGRLGAVELRAAHNWLQYAIGRFELEPGTLTPRLTGTGRPRSAITRHMRATAPQQWNDSPKGRQLTVGYAAAVGWAGWLASDGVDPAEAPDMAVGTAVSLTIELRRHAALAALDALTATMQRLARPAAQPYPAWFETVSAGAAAAEELSRSLAGSPPLAVDRPPAGLEPTCAALRRLATAYRANLAAGQHAEVQRQRQLEDAIVRMTAAADRVSARWGAG